MLTDIRQIGLRQLNAEISECMQAGWVGRVVGTGQGCLTVAGLAQKARIGDVVRFMPDGQTPIEGEIIQLQNETVLVYPDGSLDGIQEGAEVWLRGARNIAPDNSWIGRVIDSTCQPLDGSPLFRGIRSRPLRGAAPAAMQRGRLGQRLETGMAVFNTFLPIVRGQRLGLFAGSGVGKSSLLAKLARGVKVDLIVVALVGERGREVREFIENVLGPEGLARSVVVTETSDRSALSRRRCVWTAMSVAEHFRDQGLQVMLLVDSMTRFAEAHREIALSAGETSSLRGYPPSISHTIMSLCERAGPGPSDLGDITAIFSVLVAGSDMDEPIADILRGVLDGHVVLDRKVAERGRFPAIDLLRSASRSLPAAASDGENELLTRARVLLGAYERAELMIQAGLYQFGTDPLIDEAYEVWDLLDQFIAAEEDVDAASSFARLSRILGASSHTADQAD